MAKNYCYQVQVLEMPTVQLMCMCSCVFFVGFPFFLFNGKLVKALLMKGVECYFWYRVKKKIIKFKRLLNKKVQKG